MSPALPTLTLTTPPLAGEHIIFENLLPDGWQSSIA
jgi:hypothetical protein